MIAVPPHGVGDRSGVPFRPARHQRTGRRNASPIYVAIHTAECAETRDAAIALLWYGQAVPDDRPASWHYACDDRQITQSVREADTAFGAPPLNDCALHVEHAGRVSQLAAAWADPYSLAMLLNVSAPLVRSLCRAYGIPAARVSDDTLREGSALATTLAARGASGEEWDALALTHGAIVGHDQISRVFHKSAHTDPGPAFPWTQYLAGVNHGL